MPAYGLGEATLAVTDKAAAAAHSALEVDWEAPGAERSVDARSVRRGAEFGDPAAAAWIISCGTPVDGCAVRVEVDRAGETVADGVLGEVVVSGPSVAAGYVPGRGTGSLTTFDRDCLRTGDSGFSWRGELYVVGRSGDGVKVNGRSLYAEQVEIDVCRELGALLPAQQCVALLGVRSGEPLVALVAEIRRGSWVGTAASVLRRLAVAARIEIYAGTRGAITRTTSGKPARRLMWQRLTSGTLRATVVYAADGDLLPPPRRQGAVMTATGTRLEAQRGRCRGPGAFPYTEGRQVRLRPGSTADGPDCYRLTLRIAVGAMPDEAHFLNTLKATADAFFAIVSKEDGAVIGYTSLADLDPAGHVRLLVWAEQGLDGPAAEAALLTINYAFAMWAIRKVYVHVTDASHDFLGPALTPIARLEAALPDHEFFRGQVWEVRVLAIYRDDWLRLGKPLADRLAATQGSRTGAADD